jgi:cell division septation protein DedD
MATPPAEPEKMTLDRSDGSATQDLYRAVLGPLRTDYYLKTFTRFDEAGKSSPSWNTAAALLSLNWMVFRSLWPVALAYVGALMAATLLLGGIGRLIFQLSAETQWLLLALGVLLSIALPGTYGNAWLYAACNRRMERALEASSTLEEACTLLARQAGGVKRMVSLAGINVALCLIVAAIVQSWPSPAALPLHAAPVAQTQVAGLVQSALATQPPNPPAAAPSLVSSAPQAAASAVPPSQGTAARSNQGMAMVQEGAAAAAALALPSSAIAPAAPKIEPAVKAERVDKADKTSKSAKAAKLTKAERHAKAKAEKIDKADKAAKAAKAATKAAERSLAGYALTTESATASDKFLINVGLFADANNARNAFVKLQDAGLPVLSQEVTSSKGKRTRVRVGPFESQPEVQRAAERIRSLQLDAAVVKQ